MNLVSLALLVVGVSSFELSIKRKTLEHSLHSGGPLDYDIASSAYTTIISLGNPGQDLKVALDLNSPVLWVPDASCSCDVKCNDEKVCATLCAPHCCGKKLISKPGACTNKNIFNIERSHSYIDSNSTLTVPFLDGEVQASTGFDTLRLGPHYRPGLTANHLEFGVVKEFSDLYPYVNYDGVLGIGYGNVGGLESPIKQLAELGVIPLPLLTVYVEKPKPDSVTDGVLNIGQVDRLRCQPVKEYTNIEKTSGWVVNVTGFNLTDHHGVMDDNWKGIFDFSTEYIHLPHPAYKTFAEHFAATYDHDGHMLITCSSEAILSFNIGGRLNYIEHKDIVEYHGGTKCVAKVKETPDDHKYHYIFGVQFLTRKCLILDFNGRLALTNKK